jgi:anti-anti-sigma regulatory factor
MKSPNFNCDQIKPTVRVVRFLRPDLRDLIYDGDPVTECSLYKELDLIGKLSTLAAGDTLIVNFAMIDWFPSMFYQILLALRVEIQRKQAHLIFCCLPPNVRESFDIMGGSRTFEVRATEIRAISDASKK